MVEFGEYSPEVNRILLSAGTDVLPRKIRANFIAKAEKLQSYLSAKEPNEIDEIDETGELQSRLSEEKPKILKTKKKERNSASAKTALNIIAAIVEELESESSDESSEEIPGASDILQLYLTRKNLLSGIIETFRDLKKECDRSVIHRSFAFEVDIQTLVLEILEKYHNEITVTFSGLEVLISMSRDQPHILNPSGIFIMLQYLDIQIEATTKQQIFRWMHVCMDHCENNRSTLYKHGVLSRLLKLLDDDTTMSPVITDICLVIRSLVDYDNSPEVYKFAVDRIVTIARTVVSGIVNLLHKFLSNEDLIKDLLITIRKLLVTKEHCEMLLYTKNNKGTEYIHDVFSYYRLNEEITCEVLKIFLVMIQYHIIKSIMLDAGAITIVGQALDTHSDSECVTEVAFECIAKTTLKRPIYTKYFTDIEIPSRIITGMQKHSGSFTIQKLGSWIIRVFLTYKRKLRSHFLELGVVDVLLKAIEKHESKCEYDAKAALRDLHQNVDMSEPIGQEVTDIDFPL